MMKKTLSLLLVLVMTVGLLPTTVVQAADTNDVVYVDEATSMSELVEQGVVQTSQPAQKPDNKPTVPQTPVIGQTKEDVYVSATVCDCGMEDTALYSHSDSCALRQYYLQACGSTAQEVYDLWRNAGAVTREFLMDHLKTNYPETLEQVRVLIDAEADPEADLDKDVPVRLEGEASATVDGVTVDALGVPEGSALTVQEPSREAQLVVQEIVEQAEKEPEQLFLYDISVQNGESDDWQPEETSVELKLSIPGLELHKYAEVRVFHVDDEGNTSIINGELDAEGSIVFETEGFSTFAGFTVDFSYGAALVSIPGETSILMSELFDQMQVPLYASDVVDVQFTDDSLLTVTRQENDWLLTSLKAFTTTEALTFTMKDGKVYQFDVTDATTPTIQTGSGNPIKDENDLTRWFACKNGLLTEGASPSKWQSSVLEQERQDHCQRSRWLYLRSGAGRQSWQI